MLKWGGWGWGGELGVVVKCEFKCPFPSARFDGQLFGET